MKYDDKVFLIVDVSVKKFGVVFLVVVERVFDVVLDGVGVIVCEIVILVYIVEFMLLVFDDVIVYFMFKINELCVW